MMVLKTAEAGYTFPSQHYNPERSQHYNPERWKRKKVRKAEKERENYKRIDDSSVYLGPDMPSLLFLPFSFLFHIKNEGETLQWKQLGKHKSSTKQPSPLHLSLMTTSPEKLPDFRAPPPSPNANASARRSSVVNDEAISEFLEHSLRIPKLVLPDRIFPVEIPVKNPPEIDFQSLISSENDAIMNFLDSVGGIGCFLLVNHGIDGDLIRSVVKETTGLFGLSSESKTLVSRTADRMYGFEEEWLGGNEEEVMETSEEFVWCTDEGLKSEMEGIWSQGYSNFSQKMENLSIEIEKVACKLLQALVQHAHVMPTKLANTTEGQEMVELVCCLYKHCRYSPISQWDRSLKSDIIRMLIQGSDFSHALCVHICDGASDFHIYSKKGWISFCPDKDAIVVTIGDQIQTWSSGQYKNVMGRPVFKVKDEESISMAFLYSPSDVTHSSTEPSDISHSFAEHSDITHSFAQPSDITHSVAQTSDIKHSFTENKEKRVSVGQSFPENRGKAISIKQQIIIALLITLIYHFSVCIYKI